MMCLGFSWRVLSYACRSRFGGLEWWLWGPGSGASLPEPPTNPRNSRPLQHVSVGPERLRAALAREVESAQNGVLIELGFLCRLRSGSRGNMCSRLRGFFHLAALDLRRNLLTLLTPSPDMPVPYKFARASRKPIQEGPINLAPKNCGLRETLLRGGGGGCETQKKGLALRFL